MKIVKTKIYLPVYDKEWLERRNIYKKLGKWRGKKLILVSAAAGYGKTNFMCIWMKKMQEVTYRVAWYSLDEYDNDKLKFVNYLLTAIKNTGALNPKGILNLMNTVHSQPLTETFSCIINMFHDNSDKTPLFIVLDSYHNIIEHEIHQGIDFLLRYLPPHIHLVIISRSDPPLNLAALRVKDQIIEIRSDDLIFTYDECAEFILKNSGSRLKTEAIEDLYQKTEGWIAGLKLALTSFQKGSQDVIPGGENSFITDYLNEEVYSRLPFSLKNFLLCTSLLECFNEDLCEAVTGSNECAKILEIMRRENLFLVPLDSRWFRYHRMFSSFLRRRIKIEMPERIQSIYFKAALWYRENGYIQEAFDYAILSQNEELLSELAEKYIEERLWTASEHTPLLNQLDRLPEFVLHNNAPLQLCQAILKVYSGKVYTALSDIRVLERRDDLSDESRGILETVQAIYGCYIKNTDMIIKHASRAIELLDEQNYFWRNNAVLILGYNCFLSGNMLEAEKYFKMYYSSRLAFPLAETLQAQGRLQEAKQLCLNEIKKFKSHGSSQPDFILTGSLYSVLGSIACEENYLDTAFKYAVKGVELNKKNDYFAPLYYSYKILVIVHLARREYKKAKSVLKELLELQKRTHSWMDIPAWVDTFIRVIQVGSLVWEEKHEKSIQKLQPVKQLSCHTAHNEQNEITENLFLARIFLLAEQKAEAAVILEKYHSILAKNHYWLAYLYHLINCAAYRELNGLFREAENTLNEALEIGKRGNFVRIFIDAAALLQPILLRMQKKRCLDNYGIKVRYAVLQELYNSSAECNAGRLAEPLSPREMEILKMLPSEMGYPEIAEKLFISYNTIRSHVKNIYQKLDAHNRLDAVNIAKTLKLL